MGSGGGVAVGVKVGVGVRGRCFRGKGGGGRSQHRHPDFLRIDALPGYGPNLDLARLGQGQGGFGQAGLRVGDFRGQLALVEDGRISTGVSSGTRWPL
ncbi:MAG: hypothetical protein HC875_19730 [Anaerolineales bacterium]|nr:hypothetical protein [Anaerolineales bacterium]